MKNVILVHGCCDREEFFNDEYPSGSNSHWFPWMQKQLNKAGIESQTPEMPAPYAPVYEEWGRVFEQFHIDDETILVGHSCGCAFLVRWLGDSKKHIRKLILVAPWKIPHEEVKKEFYEFPIDESVRLRVKEIVTFTADNEDADGKESLKMFSEVLEREVIELKGRGHYTRNDMGTEKFPELLETILK